MAEDLRRRMAGEPGAGELVEDDLLVGELREELERGAGVGVAGAGELLAESAGNETRPFDFRGVCD